MPTSEHWQIPKVVDSIARVRPRSVLDVGAGYGKYGLLAREFGHAEQVDALDVNTPRFPVYDRVFLGDLKAIDTILPLGGPRYDLILFIDVIEHLEKADGWRALAALAARGEQILVTTPWGFRPQEIPGMPFETHRSGWHPWEFRSRYRVLETRVFPGHYSRWLRIPKLWQFLVRLAARGSKA